MKDGKVITDSNLLSIFYINLDILGVNNDTKLSSSSSNFDFSSFNQIMPSGNQGFSVSSPMKQNDFSKNNQDLLFGDLIPLNSQKNMNFIPPNNNINQAPLNSFYSPDSFFKTPKEESNGSSGKKDSDLSQFPSWL